MHLTALIALNKKINSQAKTREYLIGFINNLPITTSNSIQIQATSLAHLTKATNQLTRTSLVRVGFISNLNEEFQFT